ncbi:ankyrin [Fragilariopsis cylindrus CCMP1102]|uniref:Ankyrin n=1 Tax=Fragilariopsis cylindrus CCMP1102 TaxID=635003 RepID=A0A1E7FK33_9STRA|nr:ankyrin [Fragilariopsis cylindrus CCMP1102]|eukprot:OEU18540.1 ankyrin [Fragilariopsis cylindrus CCMP1102]
MFNGDDSILVGGSSRDSLIFSKSISGITTMTDNKNNNQHPLKVSRSVGHFSKSSPSLRGGEEGGGGENNNSSGGSGVKGISSVIHDAARITDWQTVVELCQQQPENAAFTGRDGWTALHHACNRRCPYPNVVESLIRAYPDALLIVEEKGWLPLHYACRFKAPKEVVRLLLQMYPDKGSAGVSRPDRKGRSPLYYAVRYDAPSGVVGLLLEVDASAVLEEDQNADSPLALVWDDWAEKLDGKRTIQKILDGTDVDLFVKSKMVRKRLESQTKVFDRWNKVNVFLKAAFGFSLDEDWEFVTAASAADSNRRWRILHAISAIKCHYSLFLLAISLHPEQAFELDRNNLRRIDNIYKSNTKGDRNKSKPSDLTALHLAASSSAGGDSGKMVLTQLLALNPDAAESVDTEGSTPLHRISENNFKSDWNINGVEEVYCANINAIRTVDINGRLPLHRASSSIRNYDNNIEDDVILSKSVLCRLLQLHDEAARCSDYLGCHPLHLVAQHGKRWDVQVQALYDANTAVVRVRTGVKLLNRLPIHLATANVNSDFSLISKLVEYNPRGTSQADRKGFLPLHLACVSGLSWKSVQLIHEAFPGAVRQAEQNRRGWNALHMAASSKCSDDELISNLVQLYPEAASDHDSDARYPLHLACLSGKDWDGGLSSLFEANANAIRCRDKDGLLPLHIVALRYRTKSNDDDDSCEDNDNQLTAKETKEAKELSNIFELLKADPTVLL